jgi:hypothetical protein
MYELKNIYNTHHNDVARRGTSAKIELAVVV